MSLLKGHRPKGQAASIVVFDGVVDVVDSSNNDKGT